MLSLVNITAPFTMITFAQEHLDSALTSILSSTTPLFVFVIASTVLHDEHFTWQRSIGTIIAFSGIVYLFAGAGAGAGGVTSVAAVALVVGSAAIFAGGNVSRAEPCKG